MVASACPDADVICLGTPYGYWDTTHTLITNHNRMVRNVAVRYNRPYVDLMQPGISFDWLNTNGLMGPEGVHLTHPDGQWTANLIWNDLGFYALAAPRSVSLQLNGSTAYLSFLTTTGAVYSLERSASLEDWSVVSTRSDSGAVHSTNLPKSAISDYFRLRLQPP